ncbi:hypothetical protein ACFRFH_01915 [Leifsonia sp. NPDC056824]|uniref:hypothetical protein n=1 Tax=Leifsonia sp. NPDC056824 TaxID=3345953 RepID=UPI0036B39E96
MTTELTRQGDAAPEPDGGKRRRHPKEGAPSKAQRTPKGRGAKKDEAASAHQGPSVLREEPRVDLLPPEVKTSRRHDAIARRLVLALVVVIVLVAAAIGGSTFLALQAGSTLAAAQQQTTALTSQQQKYVGVRQVQNQIALAKAGQEVGASTEIDWTAFLSKARATIGGGLSLSGITIDSASPLAAYQQSAVPLEGARVATVTIDVHATNLDEVSAWLAQLAALPSVTDVSPASITLDQSGYTASAIMHLDASAFDGRFATKGK